MRSRFSQEIRSCISGWDVQDNDRLNVTLVFPPHFIGFQGHFPDNPIFPGVCHVHALVEIARKWLDNTLQLIEIARAKFFFPVRPNDALMYACKLKPEAPDGFLVSAEITCRDQKAAVLKIHVAAGRSEDERRENA